jgi:hypothetical protein
VSADDGLVPPSIELDVKPGGPACFAVEPRTNLLHDTGLWVPTIGSELRGERVLETFVVTDDL